MKTVIMAGGKGTRISSINNEIPKPMITINGTPVLEHQLNCLKRQGIKEITIVVGYLKEKIISYFEDGQKIGIKITYIEEKEPLGTAGALFYFNKLEEDVLLLNGDLLFDIDIASLIEFHRSKNADITVVSHPNSHPYDSTLLQVDKESKVVEILTKENRRELYQNRVNAGIHVLSSTVLEDITELKKIDLDRDILPKYVNKGTLFAYDTAEYIKDMGTPGRYYDVCEDAKKNIPFQKNKRNMQKAVFLDRDGTINKHKGFITKPEQLVLCDEAAEAIRRINSAGYIVIVITNQPVVARGECTLDELNRIHDKMEVLLGEQGAYINDIFVCPHHPDGGFEGEVKELKIECECRKPKPGLLLQAAQKYNIDLSSSFMIGDSDTDILAGKSAGCKTYLCQDGIKVKEIELILDYINRL